MPEHDPPLSHVPEATTVERKKGRPSLVWIIPIAAALLGVWVAVTTLRAKGPEITIEFLSAEGLEQGKTKVRYNGVDVGTVAAFHLSDDHQRVVARVEMAPKTESFLVEDTKFWVVRPRISGANVSGLGTLISGAYVSMEIGNSRVSKRDFVTLKDPPVIAVDAPGRFFLLRAADLGSLDTGTPVFFRKLQVGQVVSYGLDADGKGLTVKIFVDAPHERYVTQDTRFWHASGIDVSLAGGALNVQTQSLLSILIGGIAFETPPDAPVRPPADANAVFDLFANRTASFAPPPVDPQEYQLVFEHQSVRGLAPGAAVEFQGIPIGEVVDLRGRLDRDAADFDVKVTVRVDVAKLELDVVGSEKPEDVRAAQRRMVDTMVAHGARAQLKTGSLLTGSLFIAVDFHPDVPPATVDWTALPPIFPTVPGTLELLESSLARIMKRLESLPLEQLGADVTKALGDLDQLIVSAKTVIDDAGGIVKPDSALTGAIRELQETLASARKTLDHASEIVKPDSALGGELSGTLDEVSRAAHSLRVLLEYLERHPEALIRGKSGEEE